MANQLFLGKIVNNASQVKTNFVIFQGDVSSGASTITNISTGTSKFRVGQFLTDPAGAFPSTATILSVDSNSQITVDQTSTQTLTGQTFGLNTPDGTYYISGSFTDPNNINNVNSITGSNDSDFSGSYWSVIAPSKDNGGTSLAGVFHSYNVTSVVDRVVASSTIDFFIEYADSGSESSYNQYLDDGSSTYGLVKKSDLKELTPSLSKEVSGLSDLPNGIQAAALNIAIPEYLDKIVGEADSDWYDGGTYISASTEVRITGSTNILGDLTVKGTGSFDVLHTTYETSSIIYSSGSTKFGDTLDDTHQFTGSVSITGSLSIDGLQEQASETTTLVIDSNGVVGYRDNAASSGTSGTSGVDGTHGTSGTSGIDGTHGTSGTSGADGTHGTSGTSGENGTSGTSGENGTSGTSGTDGTHGTSGTSGVDGTHGTSGTSGENGTSGTSGENGTSGTSGENGTSGTSGVDGTHGTSGSSGINGENGTHGTSGTSGIDGENGTHGTSGTSGINGENGTHGTSGTSGINGENGTHGTSGSSGTSGTSGEQGTHGTSGTSGTSGLLDLSGSLENGLITYDGDGSGTVESNASFNNNTLTITGSLIVTDTASIGYLETIYESSSIIYSSGSTKFGDTLDDTHQFTGSLTVTGSLGVLDLQEMPTETTTVVVNSDGTFGYRDNAASSGTSGTSGENGTSGTTGTSGTSGENGTSGTTGTSGTSGENGTSGTTGTSGTSGTSGINGENGTHGTSGTSGENGTSGTTGTSGTSGTTGTSGTSGVSGISAGQSYYLNNSINSDVSGFKELSLDPTSTGEVSITTTLSANQSGALVQQFITPELGFSVIPKGTQRFHLHLLLPGSNDDVDVYVEIQIANSSGTPIGSTITSNVKNIGWVSSTDPDEIEVDIVLPTTSISTTDRMIVRVYLNNNDNQSHDVDFYTEGNANYSFVVTSVGQIAGTSGTSGSSGSSGTSGTNGTHGTSGTTGTSGTSGNQGSSGSSGSSGVNGENGTHGTSGTSGNQGSSGTSGTTGTSGTNGTHGTSGTAGTSGTSGNQGENGTHGTSGINGENGTHGTSGTNGADGTHGTSGTAGTSGESLGGGYVHTQGVSSNFWAITHSLNTRPLNVEVYDNNFDMILNEFVSLPTANTAEITFPSNQTGYAIFSSISASYTQSNSNDTLQDVTTRGNTTSNPIIINSDLTVSGTGSFGTIHSIYETSSIIYSSGSTKFGDTLDDTHQFTGSVEITGSLDVNGNIVVDGNISSTVFQTSYGSDSAAQAAGVPLYGLYRNGSIIVVRLT